MAKESLNKRTRIKHRSSSSNSTRQQPVDIEPRQQQHQVRVSLNLEQPVKGQNPSQAEKSVNPVKKVRRRHSHSVESLPISKITENPFVLRDNRKKTETKSTKSLAKKEEKSPTKTETKSTNSLNRSTKKEEKLINSLNRSTKKEEKSSTRGSNLLRRFSVNIGRNEEKPIANPKQEIQQIDPVTIMMGNGQKTALFTPRVTRFGTVSKAMWKQPPPTFDNPIEEVSFTQRERVRRELSAMLKNAKSLGELEEVDSLEINDDDKDDSTCLSSKIIALQVQRNQEENEEKIQNPISSRLHEFNRRNDGCVSCGQAVYALEKFYEPKAGAKYHPHCFRCDTCGTRLSLTTYCRSLQEKETSNKVYCRAHQPRLDKSLDQSAISILCAIQISKDKYSETLRKCRSRSTKNNKVEEEEII